MPFAALLPAILAGASALGGLFSDRGGQQQTQDQSGRVTPIKDPTYGPLEQALLQKVLGQLSGPDYYQGLEASGVRNINRSYQGGTRALDAIFSQRGITGSPATTGAYANMETSRAGDIGNFLSSQLPLLQEQIEQNRVNQALQMYGMQPIGQQSTGTVSGNISSPGWGNAIQSGTNTLGYFMTRFPSIFGFPTS